MDKLNVGRNGDVPAQAISDVDEQYGGVAAKDLNRTIKPAVPHISKFAEVAVVTGQRRGQRRYGSTAHR